MRARERDPRCGATFGRGGARCLLPRGHRGRHLGRGQDCGCGIEWPNHRQADVFDEAPEGHPGAPSLFHQPEE